MNALSMSFFMLMQFFKIFKTIPSGKIVPDISYLCIKRENNGTGETESFVIILEHGKGYLGF